MNSFSELVKKRRSTRKFTDELLTPEQVEAILKAALMSPASKSSNPWQFIAVEDKETLKTLSTAKEHGAKLIEGCAFAVVVIADSLASDVWIEDSSITSIVMQLQAEDMGLGSCWVQIRERYTADGQSAEAYIRNLLDIPMQFQVLSIIAIGHKVQEKPSFDEEKLQWEKIHINKFRQHG